MLKKFFILSLAISKVIAAPNVGRIKTLTAVADVRSGSPSGSRLSWTPKSPDESDAWSLPLPDSMKKRLVTSTADPSSFVFAPIISQVAPVSMTAFDPTTTQSTTAPIGIPPPLFVPSLPAVSTSSMVSPVQPTSSAPAPVVVPPLPMFTTPAIPPTTKPPQPAPPPPVKPPTPDLLPVPEIPHVEPLPTANPPKPTSPPVVKPSDNKPSSTDEANESSCTATTTPTITVSVSYPLDSYGVFHTATSTITPSDLDASCNAMATTTTTTAKFETPSVLFATGPNLEGPRPTEYPDVDKRVQQYLGDLFVSLGIQDTDSATSTSSAAHATATCDGKTYANAVPSAAAFIQGLLPSFCSEWSAKPGDTMSKSYTAKDIKDKPRRQLSLNRRTPPPAPLTQDSYPGWSVDFEWRADHATGDCLKEEYCTNSLTALLSQCKGYSLADAYSGGQSQDECGTLRYMIKGFPAIKSDDTTCDLPTVDDPGSKNTPHQYQQKAFEAAATMFCRDRESELVADPQGSRVSVSYWENTAAIDQRTKLPAVCYPDGDSSLSYSVGNSWDLCKAHPPSTSGRYDSDSNIALSIVPSPSQKGCSALGKHKIPKGDDCYNNFMQIVSSCMPEDGGGKVGVWKESSDDGCWDWWVWGRELYK